MSYSPDQLPCSKRIPSDRGAPNPRVPWGHKLKANDPFGKKH